MEILTNHQDIFCLYVCVHAGSIYENPKQAGMSHVLEHMLLKRTKQYTKAILIDKLAEIGGIANASTDKDVTTYYIVTTCDNWKRAVDILSSVIKYPEIATSELELEKNVIVEEINMRRDNYLEYYNKAVETILPTSNVYAKHVEGTPKLVLNLNKHYLLEYYKKQYDKYNVVANCPIKLKKEVENYMRLKFGPSKNIPKDNIQCDYHSKLTVAYCHKQQYTHVISFPSFARNEQKKNCILNFIRFAFINGSFKSKFMNVLRTKMGLVYSVSSMNDTYLHLGLFAIELSTTANKVKAILEISLKLLERLKQDGLSEKDLRFFKKAYKSSKQLVFSDEQFRTGWHCENIFYGSVISEKKYAKMITDITNDDIKKVAKEVFDMNRVGILVYGKYKNIAELQKYLYKQIILSHQSRYEDSTII